MPTGGCSSRTASSQRSATASRPRRTRSMVSPARSSHRGSSTRTTTCSRRSRGHVRRRRISSRGSASSTRSGQGSTPRPSTQQREQASRSSRSRAARPPSTTTTSSRAGKQGCSKPRYVRRWSSASASSPHEGRWTSASRVVACRLTRSSRNSTTCSLTRSGSRRRCTTRGQARWCRSQSRRARRSPSRSS